MSVCLLAVTQHCTTNVSLSTSSHTTLHYASLTARSTGGHQRNELCNPHNVTCLSICPNPRFIVQSFNKQRHIYERLNYEDTHTRARYSLVRMRKVRQLQLHRVLDRSQSHGTAQRTDFSRSSWDSPAGGTGGLSGQFVASSCRAHSY